MLGRKGRDDVLAGQLDLLAVVHADKLDGHPAAVEPLPDVQQPLDVFDRFLRQVDRRRLHLHHPPPRDEDGDRGQMIEMRVRDEDRLRAGE